MVLFIDGGCSGNWQKDMSRRSMVTVVTDGHGDVVSEWRGPGGSNNIAELLALRDALKHAVSAKAPEVTIYTDSQNTQAWVKHGKVGKGINDRERVIGLLDDVRVLRQSVSLLLLWVPREQNFAGHVIEEAHNL